MEKYWYKFVFKQDSNNHNHQAAIYAENDTEALKEFYKGYSLYFKEFVQVIFYEDDYHTIDITERINQI